MFDGADWELRWPRALLVRELGALLAGPPAWARPDWDDQVRRVFEEAFAGPAATRAFEEALLADLSVSDPLSGTDSRYRRELLERLVAQAGDLREATERAPYWSQRRASPAPAADVDAAQRAFVRLVDELHAAGYLARSFPAGCVDDPGEAGDPSTVLDAELGVGGLWPLDESAPGWDRDLFYDLIEVFHDLVARPQTRWLHDFSDCGWHYGDFALEPARILYRWRVNRLMARHQIPYRLAEAGDDEGRLVATTDDGRADLVDRALAGDTGGRVAHAIALYRARTATDHDKRSAIVVLASLLEERRALLKARLFSKDEGALFQIANEFALRHRNEAQKSDYDPAFLDWVFWWYLATVELGDRLAAGATIGPAP
ncbi:MAG: hypothetical protein QOD57_3207 [Actinomycetota bacterium]|nr:hypothetical protein [Actinomycetota bacterium]MDQ1500636.1 hypothetical protein [Actinomycetota bacterium]MDQ1505480.1 hypothetical protein [Actinomycetota bacterium]MDQ1568947.1 hypothetical protein [Actinomycetota bacterium]